MHSLRMLDAGDSAKARCAYLRGFLGVQWTARPAYFGRLSRIGWRRAPDARRHIGTICSAGFCASCQFVQNQADMLLYTPSVVSEPNRPWQMRGPDRVLP